VIFMDPAKVILSDPVASHCCTATILLNNSTGSYLTFIYYLLSFILAYDLAFETIPNSLYL